VIHGGLVSDESSASDAVCTDAGEHQELPLTGFSDRKPWVKKGPKGRKQSAENSTWEPFSTQRPWWLQSSSQQFDPPIPDFALIATFWTQLHSVHTTSTCCCPQSLINRAHQPHPVGITLHRQLDLQGGGVVV